ncbi:hypothetical protein BDN67DRAFT_913952, partial [Paxillus ammoniavirescens]
DPLVHHRWHFGRAVHAFCNVQMLITNGLLFMGEEAYENEGIVTAIERKEYAVFCELLRMVPRMEARLMESSEEEVVHLADLVMSLPFLTSSSEALQLN